MVSSIATNTTGWSNLIRGDLVGAVVNMFNAPAVLNGWLVPFLFFVFQFMLYVKTRSGLLCWIIGMLFASLYISSMLVPFYGQTIIIGILIMELGGIIYFTFVK